MGIYHVFCCKNKCHVCRFCVFFGMQLQKHREYIATEMSKSAAAVLLPTLPSTVEEGKWTKTVAAVDFQQVISLPEPLIKAILAEAGKTIKMAVVIPDEPIHTLSFSASQSVRLRYSVDMSTDRSDQFKLQVTLLTYNATRLLHSMYFKASRDLHDPLSGPMVLDYINPEFSAATAAVQYTSSLAAGVAHVNNYSVCAFLI